MSIKLPVSRAVSVTLSREDRFPTSAGFNTALLLSGTAITSVLDASNRTKLYSNMDEIAVDHVAGSEVYLGAQRFFQARVRPPQLKVGYRNPAAGDITTELDAIWAADQGWYWGLHGSELNDAAAQRKIADWAETKTVLFGLDSNDVDTENPASIADATSTVTVTIATPGVFTWAAHGLLANDQVRFTTTGALPTGLVAGTAYFVRNPATNTFEVAATSGGASIATTGTQSGTHTATAPKFGGSIAGYTVSKGYDRSPVFYHTDPAARLAAGAWGYTSGRDLDRANYRLASRGQIDSGQVYTLKFKAIPGITPINRGSAAVQAITGFVPGLGLDKSQGHLANTYVELGGLPMIVEGSVPSGSFVDEIHFSDWIVARMSEAVLALLANNARIPYSNQGAAFIIEGAVNPTMRRGFAAGGIRPIIDDDGNLRGAWEVAVDDIESVPGSQRHSRIAPDIKVTFYYGGAFHFVSVTMTLRY